MQSLIYKFDTKINNLFIKREDLLPFSFGGNKARKAELFFQDIETNHADCVVTYGSGSSNHCRIVANAAAMRGMKCYIISPEEASKRTFNSQMMELFGAEITVCPVEQVSVTIDNKMKALRQSGKNPYFIMGGGHGNLGTQAYVDCYEEIREYEQKENVHFDYIFHASGTGTTQAGLICGQLMHGDERKIVGISIARKKPRGRNVVIESVKEYLQEKNFKISEELIEKNCIFCDDYVGDGYGKDSDKINQTIVRTLIDFGISLDQTYTGKAFYGMQEYLSKNQIKDKNVLFIHTGGTPLFFDYLKNGKVL